MCFHPGFVPRVRSGRGRAVRDTKEVCKGLLVSVFGRLEMQRQQGERRGCPLWGAEGCRGGGGDRVQHGGPKGCRRGRMLGALGTWDPDPARGSQASAWNSSRAAEGTSGLS